MSFYDLLKIVVFGLCISLAIRLTVQAIKYYKFTSSAEKMVKDIDRKHPNL